MSKTVVTENGNGKIGEPMGRSMAEEMVIKLLSNAAGLRYGRIVASVRVHEGRVVKVVFSTTELRELKKVRSTI